MSGGDACSEARPGCDVRMRKSGWRAALIASRTVAAALAFVLVPLLCPAEEETRQASVHAGFLYPNGVDAAGYTVERRIRDTVYGFYTFGLPSLAAAGLSYYADYAGSGLHAAVGVGIGSVLYASVAYQWQLAERHYLKTGGGFTTGIAYTGLYPVLSYEFRF